MPERISKHSTVAFSRVTMQLDRSWKDWTPGLKTRQGGTSVPPIAAQTKDPGFSPCGMCA